MILSMNIYLFLYIFLASFVLVTVIHFFLIKFEVLDTPNIRSLHSIATPRGGGLAIAVCFLVVVGFSVNLPNDIVFAIIGSGILTVAVGFWDDQVHIAARWRLLSHFMAAAWVLFFLGEPPVLQVSGFNINMGWFGVVAVAFCLVWLLNLFNFMDGVDGIAASETIFVACAGAYFSWLIGLDDLSYISLVLASSTMGFLVLNWPPARIFMGDVGSGFLGLMLGVIAYISILKGGSIWIWLILLGAFLTDSSITLLRRIISGDKWYEAHCSHAYQHAASKWGHKRVTVTTNLINICWLFPVAYMAYLYEEIAVLLVFLAYAPLIIMAVKFKAGIATIE
jgi:Fuc2NAc and GlcNAc transferase